MCGAPGRHMFYAAFDDSPVEIRRRSKLHDEGGGVVKVTHGKGGAGRTRTSRVLPESSLAHMLRDVVVIAVRTRRSAG